MPLHYIWLIIALIYGILSYLAAGTICWGPGEVEIEYRRLARIVGVVQALVFATLGYAISFIDSGWKIALWIVAFAVCFFIGLVILFFKDPHNKTEDEDWEGTIDNPA